jgi:hypothetical protein
MAVQTDVTAGYVTNPGKLVTNNRTRLKGICVTSLTVSARNMAVCEPTTVKSGTYSQSLLVITVTIAAHGLVNGQRVFLEILTGNSRAGVYPITYIDANSFSVAAIPSQTASGNVNMYPGLIVELDTFNSVGLPIKIPGEGVLCPNGFFVGTGPSVTCSVFYG